MNTNKKSLWHFNASRSGLVPILIFDCVIAYFYYGWRFTDGDQGIPPEYTLAVLSAVHGLQVFVLLLEVAVRTCQWLRAMFIKVWSNLDTGEKDMGIMLAVMMVVVLGINIASWYEVRMNPRVEGTITMSSDVVVKYTLFTNDKSVHYYMQRRDPRDGIVVTQLCTDGSNHLMVKTYVRCLYREPSVVMGRPPARAPGKWVTDTLTKQDEEVLEALKKNGVLK